MSAVEIISLYHPPDQPKTDLLGQQYQSATETVDAGSPELAAALARGEKINIKWTVRAHREDRGGREALIGDALVGQWTTRFTLAASAGLRRLDERWWITDAAGLHYDIEAVAWQPRSRRRKIWIYAIRRNVLRASR